MSHEKILRWWFHASAAIALILLAVGAWAVYNRDDRRIDREMASLPQVLAYHREYAEDPLQVWLRGDQRFLSLYAIESDDFRDPDYAMLGQVGNREIRCFSEQLLRETGVGEFQGIHLTNLAAALSRRNALTPTDIIVQYKEVYGWASLLPATAAEAKILPRDEHPERFRFYMDDLWCWSSLAVIPLIPSNG